MRFPRRVVHVVSAFLFACPPDGWADLSFVQISQAQVSHGKAGVFGKTWVTLSGLKMRLVSGYARQLTSQSTSEPHRVIQILDLEQKTRFVVYPETKTYARAPLADLDYGNPRIRRRGKSKKLKVVKLTFTNTSRKRRLLDTDCEHYRMRAELALTAKDGSQQKARLEQDVWVAPLKGELSKTLLDLITFENAYREATGGALSPLDYERYQLREAAAYLQVPPQELKVVVERIRKSLRDLASYPVASSVAWWRTESAPADPPPKPPAAKEPANLADVAPKPRLVTIPPIYDVRRFIAIDWRSSDKAMDRMYVHTRRQFGSFPMGPLKAPASQRQWSFLRLKAAFSRKGQGLSPYQEFRDHLQRTIILLYPPKQPVKEAGPPAENRPAQEAPFYEIYAELHGLESEAALTAKDVSIPDGYTEVPYKG